MNNEYNIELGKFITEYPKQQYNSDWKLLTSLTYRNPIKNEKIGRRKVKNLVTHLKKKGLEVKGIYSCELDNNFSSIHHHLLIHTDKENKMKDEIFNFWKYNGWVDVEKVNDSKSVSIYISKYLNRTNHNDWDFLELI
jgi:hypothetical protein